MKKAPPNTSSNGCPFSLELVLETARELLRADRSGMISEQQIEAAAACSMKLLIACQEQMDAYGAQQVARAELAAMHAEEQQQLEFLKDKYPQGLSFDEYAVYMTTTAKSKDRPKEEAIAFYKNFQITEYEQAKSMQLIPDVLETRSTEQHVQDTIGKAISNRTVYDHAEAVRERSKFVVWHKHYLHEVRTNVGLEGQEARHKLENTLNEKPGKNREDEQQAKKLKICFDSTFRRHCGPLYFCCRDFHFCRPKRLVVAAL